MAENLCFCNSYRDETLQPALTKFDLLFLMVNLLNLSPPRDGLLYRKQQRVNVILVSILKVTPTNLFMLTATVLQIILFIKIIFFFSKISVIDLKLVRICLSFALTSMPDIAHLHYETKKYNFKLWYAATVGLSKRSDVAYFSSFLDCCKKVVQWLRYGIDFKQFKK